MLDCAVIGAGLAGLTAARDLVRRGLNVVVLEARGRVGGRLENVSLPDGQYVELGGQWIGTGHDQMSDLIDEFGLDVLGDSASGSFLVRLRGRLVVLPAPDEAAELTPFEIADLGSGLLRLRRLGQRFRDDPVWTRANHVWLSQDLDTWVAANMRTAGARDRFRTVYEMAFGHDSASATLQEGLMEVNSGPNLESMLAPNGGLNQQRIDGGAYRLAESMASGLGDIVRLGCEAIRVEHDDAGATVVLAGGERVRARQVISTLPPKLAMTLEHDPPLPQWRIDEANKIASGNVIKACLVYERPFWRDAGLSGQSSTDEGAVRVTFDTTVEGENRRGLLMGFFEGADAQSLSKRSMFLRQRTFTEAAVRMFGHEAAKPVDYVERDWMAEPFTRGCDGAHFEPGAWTAVGPSLSEPEGVLHWAGTEYARRFNGYMEGAVQSGRRVAGTVAVQLA